MIQTTLVLILRSGKTEVALERTTLFPPFPPVGLRVVYSDNDPVPFRVTASNIHLRPPGVYQQVISETPVKGDLPSLVQDLIQLGWKDPSQSVPESVRTPIWTPKGRRG